LVGYVTEAPGVPGPHAKANSPTGAGRRAVRAQIKLTPKPKTED